MWVATQEGLQAVRSVGSFLAEERWNQTNMDFVKHVPWDESGENPVADGDLSERPDGTTAIGATAAGSMDPSRVIAVNTREAAPTEFYIKHTDTPRVAQYG